MSLSESSAAPRPRPRSVDGLCQISRDPQIAAAALGAYVGEDVGWWKGAAQMVQVLVFAVGGYETCSD